MTRPPRPGGLLLPLAFFLLGGLTLPLNGVIMPDVAKTFGIAIASVGFTATLMVGAYALTIVTGTFVIGGIGFRPAVIGGSAALAVGASLMALAPTVFLFATGATLTGCAIGLGTAASNWFTIQSYPAERRGRQIALLNLFYSVGALGSPILAGLALRQGVHWPTFYWILAGLALAVMLWAIVTRVSEPTLSIAKPGRVLAADLPQGYRVFAVFLALALFAYVFAEYVFVTWVVSWGLQILTMPVDAAALLLSLFWLCMAIGRATAPLVIRRVGEKRYALWTMGAALGLTVAIFGLRAPWLLGAGALLLGLAYSAVFPTLQGFAVRPLQRVPGPILTIFVSIGPLGAMTAMAGTSAVLALTDLVTTFALGMVCTALSLGFIALVSLTRLGRQFGGPSEAQLKVSEG